MSKVLTRYQMPLLGHIELNTGLAVRKPRPVRDQKVAEALSSVSLPENAAERRPREFSGGERQRISLARAITADPALLILDEPTASLDVSIQARTINLLQGIQERTGVTYLFITRDLALANDLSDQIAVMRRRKIVVPYKIAWIGGFTLYCRDLLVELRGFGFWRELPEHHAGEDVAVQWVLMETTGGAGILPSGAVHLEAPTTIVARDTNRHRRGLPERQLIRRGVMRRSILLTPVVFGNWQTARLRLERC